MNTKNLFLRIKQTPGMLLAFFAAGLAFLVIILAIIAFFTNAPKKQLPSISTSYSPVSNGKESYPEATPQSYKTSEDTYSQTKQADTGSLSVTTDPLGTTAIIDPPPDAYAEAPLTPAENKRPPVQNPPFTAEGLPAGVHTIVVAKPYYKAKSIDVVIKSNMVTTINVKLDPI